MDVFGMIAADADRRATYFDVEAMRARRRGRRSDALRYSTLAADARRTADRARKAGA
jgi:hypothetical protein